MADTEYTDPARELADACEKLASQENQNGAAFLAAAFGVPAWSRDFYEIILAFQERIEYLSQVLQSIPLDEDSKSQAINRLSLMLNAFTNNSFQAAWAGHGAHHLGQQNSFPIRMLSSEVRRLVKYPKLSVEQISEILEDTAQLLGWLEEHQLSESDFIRQAIIDGVKKFQFRLSKIGWLGYGYTIESLKEVITAYVMIERGFPNANVNPDAAVVMKKLSDYCKVVFKKVGLVKEVTEQGDFFLRVYGAASVVKDFPAIAGLLASS